MQVLRIETLTHLVKLLGNKTGFLLLALVIAAPVLLAVAHAQWHKFTLGTFATTGLLYQPLITSLQQISVALVVSLLFGNLSAWLLTHYQFPYRRVLMGLQFLPLLFPTFAIGALFDPTLSQTSLPDGVRLGIYQAISSWPLVFIVMQGCFANHNAEYWYAAQSLGNNAWVHWWRLGVLLNRPTIVAVILLVVMQTLSDLATPNVLTIANLTNLTGDVAEASHSTISLVGQLSTAIMLLLIALMLIERMQRGKKQFVQSIAGYKPRELSQFSHTITSLMAYLWLVLPPLIFGVAPCIAIIDQIPAQFAPFYAQFGALGISTMLALAVAFVSVSLCALLVFGLRTRKGFVYTCLVYLASIGMVAPAIYVAITVNSVAITLDNWFAPIWESTSQSITLQHSYALGIYTLVFRYAAISVLIMQAALAGIDRDLWRAANMLGTSNLQSFIRIELRLIAPFIVVAASLVAMLSLHDSAIALTIFSSSSTTLVSNITNSFAQGSNSSQALILLALATGVALTVSLIFARKGLRI